MPSRAQQIELQFLQPRFSQCGPTAEYFDTDLQTTRQNSSMSFIWKSQCRFADDIDSSAHAEAVALSRQNKV